MPYWSLSDFKRFGFTEVGHCCLDHDLNSRVRFTVTHLHNQRVIYAFRVGRIIKYVGICDTLTTTLKKRMSRYQSMAGAGTNQRVTTRIHQELRKHKKVSIMAVAPMNPLRHKRLDLDLVKAFEYPLINRIRNGWNLNR